MHFALLHIFRAAQKRKDLSSGRTPFAVTKPVYIPGYLADGFFNYVGR